MIAFEIAILVLLTFVNGVLAMSEMSIVSSRKARLESLVAAGHRGARTALQLRDDPSRFLSTVQIGITLVGIFAGAFGGATLAAQLGPVLDRFAFIAPNGDTVAFVIVVVAITYLSLVVGELVPKRIALENPERIASLVARPMRVLSRIAAPAVWLLRVSSDAILDRFGIGERRQDVVSEDEVKLLVAEGARTGIFEPAERNMIEGVLRLADRSVRAAMTPRAEIAWIDVGADAETIAAAFEEGRYSQFLVCEGSIDKAIGLLDARDIVGSALRGRIIDLRHVAKPPLVVPETISVLQLLEQFRTGGVHFALIVDEYGTTQGIITDTDVLTSIAGSLPELGEDTDPMIVERIDGSLLVDGMTPIDEFEARLGARNLRGDGDFETVAGLVIERLGRLARAGDRVELPGMTIEIVDMDGRRIDKVLVTPSQPEGSA
jgi:putative hemolysin